MEIHDLPNEEFKVKKKKFKVVVIKRLTGHERRADEQNNNSDTEIKNLKRANQS